MAILSPRLPYGQPQQLLKLLGGSLIELEAGTDLPDDSKLLGIDHAAAVLCGLGKASTLILTSGSSGDPRFVRHNAHAHIHSALASSKRLAILQQDRWLWSLPAFHAGGLAILLEDGCERRFGHDPTTRAHALGSIVIEVAHLDVSCAYSAQRSTRS